MNKHLILCDKNRSVVVMDRFFYDRLLPLERNLVKPTPDLGPLESSKTSRQSCIFVPVGVAGEHWNKKALSTILKLQATEKMNYQTIIESVYQKVKATENIGELASYIPELAKVNPDSFAVHITSVDHQNYGVGDYDLKFSLQSISKVLTLSLAYSILGENLWERLGVEPSGTAFNSLSQLELDKGIPRNPFVNAGALVVCDILITQLQQPKVDFLSFCRHITGIKTLDYSARIVESERMVGYRNIALCHFIKSFGNIINDPDEVLDFYFNICSLEMSCSEMSKAFLFLATENFSTSFTERFLTSSQAKRINAIMQTCGFYDESGEFAFRVGLPGKSGVGGGIMAIHPNKYCIAVLSPKLNPKGNSYRGMKFLELFTTETQLSIF